MEGWIPVAEEGSGTLSYYGGRVYMLEGTYARSPYRTTVHRESRRPTS